LYCGPVETGLAPSGVHHLTGSSEMWTTPLPKAERPARLQNNSIARALLLAGVCLLAITPFFYWGNPSGHDFEFHMYSWMEVLGQWTHGTVYPRWAALAHWGYGEARFLFYPPASWTLGAALGAVLPWKLVPGAFCWIALVLAGFSMYRIARVWLRPADALFAAAFYALNPYHLMILYWRSAYAELLAAPLLPLMVLCLLWIFLPERDSGLRPMLWLSLVLAAAWLTNVPAAMMIHYSTVGVALLLAVIAARQGNHKSSSHESSSHEPSPQTRSALGPGPHIWRALARTAFAVLLGAGLASFYLFPAICERSWIDLSQVLSPGVRPQDNFLFTTLADPDHNRFNLLVSTAALVEICILALAIWFSHKKKHVGIAAPGCPAARSTTDTPWMLFSAWGAMGALLMLRVSNPLWQYLPELRYVQLPFRWLLCLNAALAMLLAMPSRRWSWTSRLLASTLLLTALILAGHRFQPPWWETSADIREMRDAIADGTGYEGTDEYVPAGTDPYELDKNLPRISGSSGAAVPSRMLAWEATEKHFIVHADAPQSFTVRLFSYPAWEVIVNGQPTTTSKTSVTGLIIVPVAAGDNDVRIYFRRTMDRWVGDAVSLISLAVFVVVWRKTGSRTPERTKCIAAFW
ncbi:MAG: hypothetical protein WBQ39_14945, partial [Terriglobales bacterium]